MQSYGCVQMFGAYAAAQEVNHWAKTALVVWWVSHGPYLPCILCQHERMRA